MTQWHDFEQNFNKLCQAYENLLVENRMLRKENISLRQQRAEIQKNQQVIKAQLSELLQQLKQSVNL